VSIFPSPPVRATGHHRNLSSLLNTSLTSSSTPPAPSFGSENIPTHPPYSSPESCYLRPPRTDAPVGQRRGQYHPRTRSDLLYPVGHLQPPTASHCADSELLRRVHRRAPPRTRVSGNSAPPPARPIAPRCPIVNGRSIFQIGSETSDRKRAIQIPDRVRNVRS
jgi:hypothetical protein